MKKEASKRLAIVQILVIFVLPVLVLYFNLVHRDWRFIFLAVFSLFIYGIIKHEEWTYEDMGLRHDNFKKAGIVYTIFTILGLVALFLLDYKLNMQESTSTTFLFRTWLFFLPVCFFQEFAYRSFLIPKLKRIFNKPNSNITIILVNTLIFTLLHIIYPNMLVNLPLVFVSGILFSWLYIKYPNFLLISISHSILNVTALLLGFF